VLSFSLLLKHRLANTERNAGIVVNVSIPFISNALMTSAFCNTTPFYLLMQAQRLNPATGNPSKPNYREDFHLSNDGNNDQ
jgi:hypothetical protein